MAEYESSLKYYRDLKGVIDTAREEGDESGYNRGKKEGEKKGAQTEKIKIARQMKSKGLSHDLIAETTGLTVKEVGAL